MRLKNTTFFSIVLMLSAAVITIGIFFYTNDTTSSLSETTIITEEFMINPITENDHILGNPDADVMWIVYSDFNCHFSKEFYPTMMRAVAEFGVGGRMALVYRNFSADAAAGNGDAVSKIAAVAAECVADIGGEIKFWEFISRAFEKLPAHFDDLKYIDDLVIGLGIEIDEYRACLASEKFEEKIQKNIDDGLAIHRSDKKFATPYNIVVFRSGGQLQFSGAESYNVIKEIINHHSFPKSL